MRRAKFVPKSAITRRESHSRVQVDPPGCWARGSACGSVIAEGSSGTETFRWHFRSANRMLARDKRVDGSRVLFRGDTTMRCVRRTGWAMLIISAGLLCGCAAPKVDFSKIKQPARPAELDAYDVFIGSWTWDAEMLNADAPDHLLSGAAEWKWTLDKRSLNGHFVSQNQSTRFEAEGKWSWHPTEKTYLWGMFNNWGYPQRGVANYDAAAKSWRMDYKSVGLDGTTSYGRYTMTVVDGNTLDWTMVEWADLLHTVKKVEMTGKYTRKN